MRSRNVFLFCEQTSRRSKLYMERWAVEANRGNLTHAVTCVCKRQFIPDGLIRRIRHRCFQIYGKAYLRGIIVPWKHLVEPCIECFGFRQLEIYGNSMQQDDGSGAYYCSWGHCNSLTNCTKTSFNLVKETMEWLGNLWQTRVSRVTFTERTRTSAFTICKKPSLCHHYDLWFIQGPSNITTALCVHAEKLHTVLMVTYEAQTVGSKWTSCNPPRVNI